MISLTDGSLKTSHKFIKREFPLLRNCSKGRKTENFIGKSSHTYKLKVYFLDSCLIVSVIYISNGLIASIPLSFISFRLACFALIRELALLLLLTEIF